MGHHCLPHTRLAVSLALIGGLIASPATWAAAPTAKPASKTKGVGRRAVLEQIKEATACNILHPQRCPALADVVELGASAVPQLLPLLHDNSVTVRAATAAALGHIAAPEAGTALLALLDDPNENVRVAAIGALGRINPEGAVEALARALGAKSVNEKLMATVALGQTGSPGAVMPLISSLSHFHPKVRAAAARALGAMRDRRATLPIGTLLADPTNRWPVRVAACESLARMGDPDGAAMLLMATSDPEPQVRLAAIRALGQLGDPVAVPLLSLLVRDPALASASIEALGRIAHMDALPALLRVLTERKLPPETLKLAFVAMGALRSPSTATALKPFLLDADPKIATWAADALGRIADESSSEALLGALKRDEQEVKEMAAWALQEISGKNLGLDVERWESWVFGKED
ncbi:MAG: HEAT repeat domain-containing protein [Deltaproteobacteria bacterium]|nr:HEAT repeat domain-containing protein [Deltaproteobacteria bacterium]